MKVLLIRPDSVLKVTPVPVGLGSLAHSLKKKRGDRVAILDARKLRLPPARVLYEAGRISPDAIGITAMTFESEEARKLVSAFKKRAPRIPVVVGGPHATGAGPGLLNSWEADYLVSGEGEETLVELLDVIEKNGDPGSVPGLAWKNGEEVVSNGPRKPIKNLSELDVDWDAVGPEKYFSWWTRNAMNTIAVSNRRLPAFFSRGCPYGCAYCHHIFGRKYRTFPVELAVGRMVELRDRHRLGEFEIIDDNFNLKPEHAKRVMNEIISRRLNAALGFTNGLRADRMDEELLDLMIKAGTYRIDYAVESASPRIQELCHKKLDLDRAREVIDMTAEKGVVTGAYYMLGFPGETEEEMEATIEFALSRKNHIASFFYLMPFPGTEFFEGLENPDESIRFGDASRIAFNLSAAPDASMMKLRQRGYREFFLNHRRVLRIARDVPKNARLLASALAAVRLGFQESVNY